jgi:2-polyprenyl-3-methyl-5-hydroxy-6-metoxy-1,4-benzoquinol methylase
MTSSVEEVCQLVGTHDGRRWDADSNRWADARKIIGERRVTLGPQASQQWLDAPDHLAMVLARYRAASALIGDAEHVLEIGCGEGIGAGILARGRQQYLGMDVDCDAISIARQHYGEARPAPTFWIADGTVRDVTIAREFGAVVALDVIEHIEAAREDALMKNAAWLLDDHGVCVIGTPNAAFDDLASPQSRAGHCNTYTHARLFALMRRYFHTVQSFGLQDTSIHLGHPEARHYLLMCGIGPRREAGNGVR